jgi:hypothetical protein
MAAKITEEKMTANSHSTPAPKPPASLVAEKRAGWHAFVQFIIANCAALAVFLLLMLLFFKIL